MKKQEHFEKEISAMLGASYIVNIILTEGSVWLLVKSKND